MLHNTSGGSATLYAETYDVDALSEPARLVLNGALPSAAPRALNAYEVAFTAHWFERREPVVLGAAPQEVPATVAGLLLPYRRLKL